MHLLQLYSVINLSSEQNDITQHLVQQDLSVYSVLAQLALFAESPEMTEQSTRIVLSINMASQVYLYLHDTSLPALEAMEDALMLRFITYLRDLEASY